MPDKPTARIVHPTPALRFILREGKRILQQWYHWEQGQQSGEEWRDVPLEIE